MTGTINFGKKQGLDYVELPDGSQVVYDHAESRVVIRRPPTLDAARAVVGLDGTPVEELWCGRLGVDNIESWRILCDCRARYLRDVIGYEFVQTTSHVKPYSSGEYVNRRGDFGVIEAVANRHDTTPGVITTKVQLSVSSRSHPVSRLSTSNE